MIYLDSIPFKSASSVPEFLLSRERVYRNLFS